MEARFDWKDCIQIGYINLVSPKSVFYSQTCLSISGFEISLDTSLEEVSLYFYFLKSDAEIGFVKESFFLFKGKILLL